MTMGITDDKIEKLVTHCPDILQYTVSCWQNGTNQLVESGFSSRQMLNIMSSFPKVLKLKQTALEQAMENLRACGLRDGDIQIVLSENPLLFETSRKLINYKIEKFLTVFTKSDIEVLCLTNPSILTDSWNNLETKIHYVLFNMQLKQNVMVKSKIFKVIHVYVLFF